MIIGGNTGIPGDSWYDLSRSTFFYNHIKKSWSDGPMLRQGRMLHAAGVVTDEFTNEKLIVATGGRSHLSNQSERCWSQYTFVNPFESDNANFTKSIFIMILRPHGGLFEKMEFEIEAFALEKQWWNPADWQWTESWEIRLKWRFCDK